VAAVSVETTTLAIAEAPVEMSITPTTPTTLTTLRED